LTAVVNVLRQQRAPCVHVLPGLRLNCLPVEVTDVDGIPRGDRRGELVATRLACLQRLK
jgi:hypothetical protein